MSSSLRLRLGLPLLLAGAAALFACGDAPSGPPDDPPVEQQPSVASVSVTPSNAQLAALADTVRFVASARDSRGAVIPARVFTWGSSDETVASVSSSGLATAKADGTATITAGVDGITGSASVTVQVPPSTGGLRLVVATVGRNLDPDGYTVTLGAQTWAVGLDDTVTVEDLSPGQELVTIDGLAANCHRFFEGSVSASVVAGVMTDVLLGVECLEIQADISLTFVRTQYAPPSVNIVGLPNGGTTPENLTFHPAFDRGPDWSPDGSRLAFSREDVIFVVNADGTDLRSFTDRGPGKGSNPDWSPDGIMKIAYDYLEQILILEPDGADAPVSLGPGYQAAWSPDGTKIAFEYYDPAVGEPEIFVMNADGSGRVNLTQRPDLLDREPTWSPDGSQIAFRRGDRTDPMGYELWVMDADGANPTLLVSLAGPQIEPTWLPDNRILFVSASMSGTQGFRIMALDVGGGGTVTQLTDDPGDEFGHSDPAWRPVP